MSGHHTAQANKATSQQANKQTSQQANKPTSQQANKPTSQQANTETQPMPISLQPNQISIGRQVRINAPARFDGLPSGTVIDIHRDDDNLPVTVRVQVDATAECLWVHRCSLLPASPSPNDPPGVYA